MALTTAQENFFRLYGLTVVERSFDYKDCTEENPRHLPRITRTVMVTKLLVSPRDHPVTPYTTSLRAPVWLRDDEDIDTWMQKTERLRRP